MDETTVDEMKDLDVLDVFVGDLLDAGGPSDRVTTAGRERLNAVTASETRRRRRRRPIAWGAAGLAVAAAAAAVLVSLDGSSGAVRGPSTEEARAQTVAARKFLLAAASSLEKGEPPPVGSWWRQRVVEGQAFRVGGNGRDYTVDMEVEKDSWESRTEVEKPLSYIGEDGQVVNMPSKNRHLSFTRPRPVAPQAASDETAWRAAGSPVRWESSSDGEDVRLTRDNAKPPPYEGSAYVQTPDRDVIGSDSLPDVNERLRVGRDPAAFVAAMRSAPGFLDDSGQRLRAGSRFLGDKLATPRSRAAAFRALAALPGVRSVGTVKDAQGRSGVALAPPWITRVDGTVVEYQLVLDPRTYDILGDQMVVKRPGKDGIPAGALFSYGYTVDEGWTNAAPPSR